MTTPSEYKRNNIVTISIFLIVMIGIAFVIFFKPQYSSYLLAIVLFGLMLKYPHYFLYILTVAFFINLENFVFKAYAIQMGRFMFVTVGLLTAYFLRSFQTKDRVNQVNLPFLLFFGVIASYLAIGFLNNPNTSTEGFQYIWRDILYAGLVYLLFFLFVTDQKVLRGVFLSAIVGCMVVAFSCFWDLINPVHFNTYFHMPWLFERPGGVYINPNEAQIPLNIGYLTTFYFLRNAQSRLRFIGALFCNIIFILALLAVRSRGGFVTAIGITVVAYWINRDFLITKKRFIPILIIIICIVLVFVLPYSYLVFGEGKIRLSKDYIYNETFYSREDVLHKAWEAFKQNPLWGNGFASSVEFAPHNMYVLFLAEAGIIPFLMYIMVIILLIYNCMKTLTKELKIVYLGFWLILVLEGFVSHNYYDTRTLIIYWAIVSISPDLFETVRHVEREKTVVSFPPLVPNQNSA